MVTAAFLSSSLISAFAWAEGKRYTIAPTQIPNVSREMKTAGFWISRIAKPDAVIMDTKMIDSFNRHVQITLKLTKDIRQIPIAYDGQLLKEALLNRYNDIKKQNYFDDSGEIVSDEFFEYIANQMALDQIVDTVKVQYGFIVRYADERFLPTEEGLYASAYDIDFDELQNSALDAATPVVILHQSADKRWFYVASELSDGWVEAATVAISEQADFESYLGATAFIVTISSKADLYLDEGLSSFYDHVRMGVKLPAVKSSRPGIYAAKLPISSRGGSVEFKTVYIQNDQASNGFLPYTPRNVLEQAFKMLNEPYGWGGMYGEQDCSRLLQEVFATVGLTLPRDSKDQAQVGQILALFKEDELAENKITALKKAPVGRAILPMKGHIMLYLGTVNGRPYAIHSLWGYREPTEQGDIVRVINRTSVSDLYLGDGSKKGSLLKRLNAIRLLDNP